MRKLRHFGFWQLIYLSIFVFACNHQNKDNQATKNGTDSLAQRAAIKQDSTAGYAQVNGLKMYYEIHGSGNGLPLVLIHGGGSTIHTSFGRILHSLANGRKVIAVELQAHGHTADIDRPLSFENDADDVSSLLKQLNITKADIFGFSNGASATLEMAIRHPEQVNKIVVASTFYKKSGAQPWFWDMMTHASFKEMPQGLKDAYLKINPDTNALYTMYKRDVTRMQSFPEIKDEDIKGIKAPALVIIGDRDVVRPEHAVEMYRMLQHGRLVILPGIHGAYLGEITTLKGEDTTPDFTVSIINNFLNEPIKN